MKKTVMTAIAACALLLPAQAGAIDLKDLLGKAGDAVTGLVEGVLTKTDITIADMEGTWTATGSAVTFKSDNALKNAGGAAMAGTIEGQLNPYYEKYGLTGSQLTVTADGNFTLSVKGIKLKGTVSKNSDGTFEFAFTPFGSFRMGSMTAYVQKPIGSLEVMFDATKLKTLISAVARLSGNSLAGTVSDILDNYEGLCVGFKYK